MKNLKPTSKFMLLALVCIGTSLVFSCSKEKTPIQKPVELTKWEIIPGHYKVYDTLGNILYEMDLIHSRNEVSNRDSIRFVNFDGEFVFTTQQEDFTNLQWYVNIGGGDTLYDKNNKRWKLWGGIFDTYNNFNNDTILLRFQKTNINYWMYDLVPYYACDCKQIAVKQH